MNKKKLFVFVLTSLALLIITRPIVPQTIWYNKTGSLTDNDLHDVFFADSLNGWLIDRSSFVFHTSDGGKFWQKQTLPIKPYLYLSAVFFWDENNGWITVHDGKVLYTSDEGAKWEIISDYGGPGYPDIYFTDLNKGWVAGGPRSGHPFMTTSNGGKTWHDVKVPFDPWTQLSWAGLFFNDPDHGWVVGWKNKQPAIIYTTDGGTNWNIPDSIQFADTCGYNLSSVHFINDTEGWTVGLSSDSKARKYWTNSTIYHTNNGGREWDIQYQIKKEYYINKEYGLHYLFVNKDKTGYAVGDSGFMVYTNNGINWREFEPVTDKDLTGVYFTANNVGWIIGKQGAILTTRETPMVLLDRLQFVRGSYALPSESWDNAVDFDWYCWDGTTSTDDENPYAIFKFVDTDTAYINKIWLITDSKHGFKERWVTKFRIQVSTTGLNEGDFDQVLDATKTKGDWEGFEIPPVAAKYIKFIIDEPSSGWRQLAEFGVEITSAPTSVMAPMKLAKVSYALPSESWENAIDGDITNWDGVLTSDHNPNPWAIFQFRDENVKVINSIQLITDAGLPAWTKSRWVKQFRVQVSTAGLKDQDFITVLDTIKTGGDWERFNIAPISAKYVKLIIDKPDRGWRQLSEFQVFEMIGGKTLQKSDNFAFQSEQADLVLPVNYALSQNYPNPFNPDTYINYQLPQGSQVVIKIFNTLGQEIRKLVDESKPAGYYTIHWDGRDNKGNLVSSGIYLYQIQAGNYSCIKKMAAIK